MKILVLGATGFIGLPAAQALVRAGHAVYGLARTQAKAKVLAMEEIIPVIGDVDSDAWIALISTLDVIIEAVGGADLKTLSTTTFERVVRAVKELRPEGAPLLSYIYTSGTWVHGDSRTVVVTDTTPITSTVELVAWRPAVEQLVVRNTVVNGIVIRPALLYGRSASILAKLFQSAAEGRVSWPGTPGGRYATIHSDDLSDLYVRVAEKASLIGGKIFDAANPNTESVDDFLQRLVDVSGAKGPYEYTKPANLFEEAIQSTGLVRPYLANALLGWSVKKPGLIEGLDNYYAAWLASST
ncbi:hypothetical protein DFH07DRAFT_856944 [Mycena maculata]|uniref:NAD-dependent epimerase/dehydratase domain-containing protein n=1 Tax=Mycena maculata TaxID=230809 RepID=A0AAD7HL20_9AGAR|nr:hypothetical protein DFH07DRAFT_856944 [Mycena maculata]